jgi:peptide/nickel transport system substrate-binding protein
MYANTIINALYDNLVKFKDGKIDVPHFHLATGVEISEDGREWVFSLRDDVLFHSGNKMTSADVKWSFERLKNLKENPAFLADNIESVETPDDLTVVIKLTEPDGSFMAKLGTSAFAVMDSVAVTAQGGDAGENAATADTSKNWLDNNSGGSGPYKLERFVPETELILVKNDDYFLGAPEIDRIIFRDMQDPNTQILTLERGDIDIAMNLSGEHIGLLEGKPGVKILPNSSMTITFLLMNADPAIGGPVSNKDVQNAIRYALDYRGLQTLAGTGSLSPVSIIQQGFLGALPPRDPDYRDLDKARELLAKAGYPDGFDIVFDVATFSSEGVPWITIGQKIQQDLSEVGINAEIRTSELMVGLAEYREGKQAFSIWAWGPDYPDANNQLAFLPGDKVGLRANWTEDFNPELAAMGRQAMAETDSDERAALLEEIQQIMAEDSPFAVFLQYPRYMAVRDDIIGGEYTEVYKLEVYDIGKN